MRTKKLIGLFELSIMLFATFSFAYLISPDSTPLVSAQDEGPKGCCLETKEGAICQDIPLFQSDLCKDSLIGTGCNVVDQCQLGCCYGVDTGSCSMRAPKDKCISNGGNWSSDASCNIPQCQLGCCVMGDQVSLTNSRECTLLSNQFNFEKNFISISPGESCEKYTGLEEQGACLSDSGDYSGEKKCVFTTRKNCQGGDFKENYLCTSTELNTVCQKSRETTCVDGKDQVYFLDSCGNVANVYDSSKINDQSYWERPIDPKDSCANEDASCGNCEYLQGSICVEHEQGVTTKPTYGDYTCKSLHCGERKHGESWCVYDFNPLAGVAPVGSRHFLANCFEGQVSLEGCADFGQEICAQSTDTSFGFTEAKCLVNDWRSCINANDAESYSEVKKNCDENPQCIMFNDLYGEDNLKRSDNEFLAGFDPEKTNAEQGSIGDLGKDQNKVLAHCVPKFTPGFQFWTTTGSIVGSGKQQKSSANYGGSNEETNAVCSLGSFTCVSQINRECTLLGGCDSWEDNRLNWECNINGVHSAIEGKDLPALLAAMNERCRSLGSCGVSTNLQGFVNEDYPGFSVERVKIDSKGKTHEDYNSSAYVLSSTYINSIKSVTPVLAKLDQIKSSSGNLMASDADTAGTMGEVSGGVVDLKDMAGGANVYSGGESYNDFMGLAGPLTLGGLTLGASMGWFSAASSVGSLSSGVNSLGVGGVQVIGIQHNFGGTGPATTPIYGPSTPTPTPTTSMGSNVLQGLKSAGITVGFSIAGSYLGGQIGGLIAKNQDWSPGESQAFVQLMGAVGGAIGYAVGVNVAASTLGTTSLGASFGTLFSSSFFSMASLGAVGLIVAIIYIIYEAFFNSYDEQEYFIMQFNCEAWQPPKIGDCDLCNNDVRPCSEYRCKSLGQRCQYFIENGEPGYCASVNEIWSAQIKPWQEVISPGNEYSSVRDNGFRIEGSLGQGVAAWTSLTFGIITDKPASCRIDSEHTSDYSQMKYEMFSSINPDTGKAEGTHHQAELNAFSAGSASTLGLVQGEENEYYIRCMNFAGQINEAEFVVQIKTKDGPDLTPPEIRRFSPETNSYLKQGSNSSDLILYLNEPAECRFDYEYDVPSGKDGYDELRHQMFCITDENSAYFGEWSCFATLGNLTIGQNNLYFRCKDQVGLEETENYPRNANFISTNYKINVCSNGLDISLLNSNTFIEEKNFTLSVSTSGCLGDAVCSFRMDMMN